MQKVREDYQQQENANDRQAILYETLFTIRYQHREMHHMQYNLFWGMYLNQDISAN